MKLNAAKINVALAGAFVIGLALPAVAQTTTTTTSYYVVQDVKTKKCTIMDTKPAATEYTTVDVGAFIAGVVGEDRRPPS